MLFKEAADLQNKHTPFVMVTILKSLGSTPRHWGKMIVKQDGSILGTIGGGPAEAKAIVEAQDRLMSGESGVVSYTLNRSSGKESLPMECGGGLDLLFEVYQEKPIMVLIGGGHVNFELAKLSHQVGFRVVVVDKREEFSSAERFPFAWKRITSHSLDPLFEEVTLSSNDAVIIATPDHDESSLRPLVGMEIGFLGMIGSRNKVLRIKQRLIADGYAEKEVNALRAPVGIDIGAETPVEIGISVLSEVLMTLRNRSGKSLSMKYKDLVVIRGGGDLATGVAHKLFRVGMPVVVLEQEKPTVIRRTVSFAQAIFDGTTEVEGVRARYIEDPAEFRSVLDGGEIPVLVDSDMSFVKRLKPTVFIDATLAKKNMGVSKDLAQRVIALGPGFEAGKDAHIVVETARGHYLGSLITQGYAQPNTGIPGNIEGFTEERIVRSPQKGIFQGSVAIGVSVSQGDTLGVVVTPSGEETLVIAPLSGVVRGLLYSGLSVQDGMKIGDIDPRNNSHYIQTISDKAKSIGGAVLEAVLIDVGGNYE